MFSVDTKQGRVAVKGWKDQVALTPEEAIPQLEPYCGAFLVYAYRSRRHDAGLSYRGGATVEAVTQRQLIVAGGIREQGEIDALDAIGVDAVAGWRFTRGYWRLELQGWFCFKQAFRPNGRGVEEKALPVGCS